MKNIIKKEIMMNNYTVMGILLLSPFLSYMILSIDSLEAYLLFTHYTAFLTGATIVTIMRQQKNIRTEYLFLSMPINRGDLLKGKYLSYILIPLVCGIVLYLVTLFGVVIHDFEGINVDIDVILFAFSISLIALAIMVPILYKWKKGYIIMSIVFFFIFLTIKDILVILVMTLAKDISLLANLTLLILALLIYVLSYKYSKISFEKRWL